MRDALPGSAVRCRIMTKREKLLCLFWGYFRISATVVGGGYAIIAAASDYFVRERKLLTEAEMLDTVALIQSVPGILACNSAAVVGQRTAGLAGALAAVIGAVLPPAAIITVLGFLIGLSPETLEHPRVKAAFSAVIAAVTSLVMIAVVRMARGVKHGAFEIAVWLASFAAMSIFKLSPLWIVPAAALAGIVYEAAVGARRGEGGA